jgi:hypothetical protein
MRLDMRWFLLALTALIFVLALRSSSPGWMGFGLLVGVVMCFVTALAFVARRIEANQRSEVYIPTPEELALLRRRAERQRQEHEQRSRTAAAQAQQPPPD